jgi:hypothetical protein
MKKQRKPPFFYVTWSNERNVWWSHRTLKEALDFAYCMQGNPFKLQEPVKYVREVKRRKK